MDSPLRDQLQDALGAQLVLQRELGGGGMSHVFLARDNALGRDVVVKVLSPQLAGELSAERFTREIRLAATLQQANIVPLLTAGVAGETPYFTMPYVDGQSLRHRLREGEPLTVTEAVDILRDVARALSYAHAHGIVHRDIKPENILLSHGAAVVTDFGIAKAVSASRTMEYAADGDPSTLTRAGVSLGTPMYMAPEQITGSDSVDHRADIYAWGCVAYELLSGAPPFVRDHVSRVLVAHIAEPARPVGQLIPGLPASLAAIVMQCLEKEPADRPSHMQDVLSALATTGETHAPRTTRLWSRGRMTVLATALFAAITGGAWWWTSRAGVGRGGVAMSDIPTSGSASLAVIPFRSVGGDTANSYLAEGIADELTTVLSRVPGLRLAGRSSSARFRDSGLTATQLGEALSVRTILLGTLRRAGDRVRVTAELSSATDGRVMWQDTFEEDARDVFRMQEQLASAIASQLQVRLGSNSLSVGTDNPEAYDQYLRGMQVYRNRGPVYTDAERYFDAAIRLDSSFARAWAGKAIVLMGTPYYALRHTRDVVAPARAAAARALALDSLNPDVHIALSSIAVESFDWRTAEREVQRAIALDSANATAFWRLGFTYFNQGRIAEAVDALERARTLDPLSATTVVYLGCALTLSGDSERGLAEATRGYELSPSLLSAQSLLLHSLFAARQYDKAADYAASFAAGTNDPIRIATMALALRLAGRRSDAERIEQRLDGAPDDLRGVWNARFQIRTGRGDVEGALDALERAVTGDGDLIPSIPMLTPPFDAVRAHPRFQRALARLHLESSPLGARPARPSR